MRDRGLSTGLMVSSRAEGAVLTHREARLSRAGRAELAEKQTEDLIVRGLEL